MAQKSRSRATVLDGSPGRSAFIGLGSNLGDRLHYLCAAVRRMIAEPHIHLLAVAGVYETEPVGKTDQPDFLNSVAYIQTLTAPRSLLKLLHEIEHSLGRQRVERWGCRTLDLDLLSMDALTMNSASLTLPHPRLTERRFVLVPFVEIAPTYMIPGMQQTAASLLAVCPDKQRVDMHITSSAFLQRIQTA